jgi:hypothetical protein
LLKERSLKWGKLFSSLEFLKNKFSVILVSKNDIVVQVCFNIFDKEITKTREVKTSFFVALSHAYTNYSKCPKTGHQMSKNIR